MYHFSKNYKLKMAKKIRNFYIKRSSGKTKEAEMIFIDKLIRK